MNKKRLAGVMLTAMLCVAGISQAADKAKPSKPSKPASKSSSKKATEKKPAVNPLLDPSKLTAQAPDVFQARFDTTKGPFIIEVHREWSPNGADRFYNLVRNGFYDDARFFRVISGFMAQFGINGKPAITAAWKDAVIPDDPVKQSNTRGMVSFAMRGPGSRTTQLFINYTDGNTRLDPMGFAPFGKVIEGMEVVDALYAGYGEGGPRGRGPLQNRIQDEGNAYLTAEFPEMDSINSAKIVTAKK